jgi:hypothetical protein
MVSDKVHLISRGTPGHWIGRVYTVPMMSQEGSSVFSDAKAEARVWKPGLFRLFISHRSGDKEAAANLSVHLTDYGISGFVAHEHIEVSEEWAGEILTALGSMQALLALVSPTFHESEWTNQEVGFALARGVPIVPICIDGTLPQGFLAKIQGMKVEAQYVEGLQEEIANLLSRKEETAKELRSALLEALIHSTGYGTTSIIYKRLLTLPALTKDEAERLKAAFKNDQVTGYAYSGKIKAMIQVHYPNFGNPPRSNDDDLPF